MTVLMVFQCLAIMILDLRAAIVEFFVMFQCLAIMFLDGDVNCAWFFVFLAAAWVRRARLGVASCSSLRGMRRALGP